MNRPQPHSILERFAAAARPGACVTVIGDRAGPVLIEELCERARRGATVLAERGLTSGDIVAVLARPSIDFYVACLSAWGCGLGVMPLPTPGTFTSRQRWKRYSANALELAGVSALLVPAGSVRTELGVEQLDTSLLNEGNGGHSAEVHEASTALVTMTSGTTGAPKGIVVSYRALAARLEAHARDEGSMDAQHFLTWRPLGYSGGLSDGLFRPLTRGVSVTVLPTAAFQRDPGRWLAELDRSGATHSGGPHFAYRAAGALLERGLHTGVDLSRWQVASDAGEPIDAASAQRFIKSAERLGFDPAAYRPRYSMSELGGITVGERGLHVDFVNRADVMRGQAIQTTDSSPDAVAFVALGVPRSDVDVEIRTEGEPPHDRSVGEIHVRSTRLLDSYLHGPAFDEHGWLHTGDRGYFADGRLYLSGRSKDVVILGGRNYFAEDIERSVLAGRDGTLHAVAAIADSSERGEGLVVVAEAELASHQVPDYAGDITRGLWRELGLSAREVVLVTVRSLPRASSGKLKRKEIAEAYRASQLERLE